MLARVLIRAPSVPQGFSLLQEHAQQLVHQVVPPVKVLQYAQRALLGIFCLVQVARPVLLVVLPALLQPIFVLHAL